MVAGLALVKVFTIKLQIPKLLDLEEQHPWSAKYTQYDAASLERCLPQSLA